MSTSNGIESNGTKSPKKLKTKKLTSTTTSQINREVNNGQKNVEEICHEEETVVFERELRIKNGSTPNSSPAPELLKKKNTSKSKNIVQDQFEDVSLKSPKKTKKTTSSSKTNSTKSIQQNEISNDDSFESPTTKQKKKKITQKQEEEEEAQENNVETPTTKPKKKKSTTKKLTDTEESQTPTPKTAKKKISSKRPKINPNVEIERIYEQRRQKALKALQAKDPNQKTFNDLAEKFQLTPEDDDETVFDEELELVAQLRAHYGSRIDVLSDRYLIWFLCARRHNMEQVIELLDNHLARRAECEYDTHEMSVLHPDGVSWLIKQQSWYFVPGMHDDFGRSLEVFIMKNNDPSKRSGDQKKMLRFLFWKADIYAASVPLRQLREGTVWVIDLKGFSIFRK